MLLKAEEDVLDTYGDYFETIGFDFNIEEYVVPGTQIPVKVLMPAGEVAWGGDYFSLIMSKTFFNGHSKDDIAEYIRNNYYPTCDCLADLQEYYDWDSSCQGTVQPAPP